MFSVCSALFVASVKTITGNSLSDQVSTPWARRQKYTLYEEMLRIKVVDRLLLFGAFSRTMHIFGSVKP